MTVEEIEKLWQNALMEILGKSLNKKTLETLSKQTNDSIRRISIYRNYKDRADNAVKDKIPFSHTSNPFVLAQRNDLSTSTKVWIIFLATYFGKSDTSGWKLFNRAAFDGNYELISFEKVVKDVNKYFNYLQSFDFFEGTKYSNHRKYTKKSLLGEKGVFNSMDYITNNIKDFTQKDRLSFNDAYLRSQKIPSFGRLSAFDFTSSLVKCSLNVEEPKSMYAENSTGPMQALKLILDLTKSINTSRDARIKLSYDLVRFFEENSDIFMTGQVLEDAICNWQKKPDEYRYFRG